VAITKIKFGTSGWRAIIADEFTFANVRLATEAIARYVKRQRSASPTILVGYDTRFASDRFALEAARVLSAQGIRALLCDRPVPTPAVAWTIIQRHLDGAINMTASHNPGEYNGLKFSTSDGAPALPEVTSEIEREIESLQAADWTFTAQPNASLIETVNIGPAYLSDLATKVDLKKIRDANLPLAYDAMHGSGGGYLDRVLADAKMHMQPDPAAAQGQSGAIEATAATLTFTRANKALLFETNAHITRDKDTMTADRATMYLSHDEQQFRVIELRGHSHVAPAPGQPSDTPDMQADDIDLGFYPGTQVLQQGILNGKAHMVLTSEAGQRSIEAPRITMGTVPDGKTLTRLDGGPGVTVAPEPYVDAGDPAHALGAVEQRRIGLVDLRGARELPPGQAPDGEAALGGRPLPGHAAAGLSRHAPQPGEVAVDLGEQGLEFDGELRRRRKVRHVVRGVVVLEGHQLDLFA